MSDRYPPLRAWRTTVRGVRAGDSGNAERRGRSAADADKTPKPLILQGRAALKVAGQRITSRGITSFWRMSF